MDTTITLWRVIRGWMLALQRAVLTVFNIPPVNPYTNHAPRTLEQSQVLFLIIVKSWKEDISGTSKEDGLILIKSIAFHFRRFVRGPRPGWPFLGRHCVQHWPPVFRGVDANRIARPRSHIYSYDGPCGQYAVTLCCSFGKQQRVVTNNKHQHDYILIRGWKLKNMIIIINISKNKESKKENLTL